MTRAACLLAALLAVAPAAAQEPEAPRRGTLEHELSVRLRPRMSTTSEPDAQAVRWELDRVRVQGRLGLGRASTRLQLDYEGGEWSVDDAWARVRLAGSMDLMVGQAKRPFTVLSMRSGSQVGPASRAATIRGTDAMDEQALVSALGFGDRAVGVQAATPLPFAPPSVRVQVGFFPADPWERPLTADGLQSTMRLTARMAPRLVVGGAWSTRRSGYAGDVALPSGTAVGVDVEAGDDIPGVHVLAEAVAGSWESPGNRFRGAHIWLMYRTGEHGAARLTFEPVLRWSAARGALPAGSGAGTLITPGLNVYLGDPGLWNRVTVNYDVWIPHGSGPGARSLKVQLQLGIL